MTGLANATTPKKSHTWTWGCNKTSCTYRYKISTSAIHQFTNEAFATTTTASTSANLNGLYYIHVQAKDSVGNLSVIAKASAILDNQPPSAPSALSIATPRGQNKTPEVTVNGVASGDTVTLYLNSRCSGTAQGRQVVPGTASSIKIVPSVALTSQGDYKYYAQSTDVAGNKSPCSTSYANYTLDLTDLRVTQLADDSTPKMRKQWTWSCSHLPCTYRYVINKNSSHTFTGSTFSSSPPVQAPPGLTGTYYIHVQAKDQRGNISPVKTASAILDNTPPLAPYSLSATGSTNRDNTPTVRVSGVSAGDKVEIFFNDATCNSRSLAGNGTVPANTNSVDIEATRINATASGTFYYYATTTDRAGNKSICSTAKARYDLHITFVNPPTSLTINSTRGTSKTPSITVSGGDVQTGYTANIYTDAQCQTSNKVGSALANGSLVVVTTNALSQIGYYTFYANLTHPDGSVSACSTASVNYDLHLKVVNPPTRLTINSTRGTNKTPSITVSGGDVQTGYTANIYTDAQCQASNKVGSALANGSLVVVTINALSRIGRYTFYANLTHSDGSASSCSTASVNYDLVNPVLAPTSLSANPISSRDSTVVTVSGGSVQAGNTVHIYTNATCTGQNVANKLSIGNSVAITVNRLPSAGVYNFYAKVIHPDGRSSDCSSAKTTFTLLSAPLASPTSVTVNTLAGTNPNPEVTVSGGGVATGTIVTIYSDLLCTKKVGSGTAFGNSVRVALSTSLSTGHISYMPQSKMRWVNRKAFALQLLLNTSFINPNWQLPQASPSPQQMALIPPLM